MKEEDITDEIRFRTARSGGKGGQNVNKVETMVEGLFDIRGSRLLDETEKITLEEKLKSRINKEGFLHVRSQAARTQLGNKERVIEKINTLIRTALEPEVPRKPTKPPPAVKQKRLREKKLLSEKKENRRKDWE